MPSAHGRSGTRGRPKPVRWVLTTGGSKGCSTAHQGAETRQPPVVAGLDNITAIAVGGNFSLALRNDGTVWAWGSNQYGALGQGTTDANAHPTPTRINGIAGAVAITAGGRHALALLSDGTLLAWGDNSLGQLGDAGAARLVPGAVAGVTGVSNLAAGAYFTLARRIDGTVWGWGAAARGQTGVGPGITQSLPAPINGLTNIQSIAAGEVHGLAVRSDGAVLSWGDNFAGQLGIGSTDNQPHPVPFVVPRLAGATQVTAGYEHSLALLSEGTVWGWGNNRDGRLGTGATYSHYLPAPVSGLQSLATPLLTPNTFWGSPPYNIQVSCATPGVTLRYTTNGQDPTPDDATIPNGGTWRITGSVTLKVRAFLAGGLPSAVATGTYRVSGANPSDENEFFVTQHYRDFLEREPDAAGLSYWTGQLDQCSLDAACLQARRVGVSAAFFIELEFQETGFFVYRFYQASLGRQPVFAEFAADRALVIGGASAEANRLALARAWVQRPAFIARYPASQNAEQFIDALLATTQQASGVNLAGLRPTLVSEYAAQAHQIEARARVLRLVADAPAFQQAEYNKAFVLMQYFGYLRRNPDAAGYAFWLDVITNREAGNYRGMVCAFITAAEYQLRFGFTATRSNADCAP